MIFKTRAMIPKLETHTYIKTVLVWSHSKNLSLARKNIYRQVWFNFSTGSCYVLGISFDGELYLIACNNKLCYKRICFVCAVCMDT